VYGNASKVMVDVEGGNNMMYLPLDKLTERAATSGGAGGAAMDSRSLRDLTDAVTEQLRRDAANSRTTNRGGR
jgi:membrane protease subunit HflK